MDYWSVLAIKPTSDKRVIKKAYAVKLKITRPDEDKNAFQILHKAYKYALADAEEHVHREQSQIHENINDMQNNSVSVEADDLEDEPSVDNANSQVIDLLEPVELLESVPDSVNKDQDTLSSLLDMTDHILADKIKRNQLQAWDFLIFEPLLLDSDFNNKLAYDLFGALARYHHALTGAYAKNSRVGTHILCKLNEIFQWDSYSDYYSQEFLATNGEDLIKQIQAGNNKNQEALAAEGLLGSSRIDYELDNYELKNLDYYFASFGKRLGAFAIDMGIVFGFALVVFGLLGNTLATGLTSINSFIVYYALIFVALLISGYCEYARQTSSLGKYFFGLRVLTNELKPLTWQQSLWRNLLLFLTWGAFYYPISLISFFINSSFDEEGQMHDRLSKTYVVDFDKSKEVYLKKKFP